MFALQRSVIRADQVWASPCGGFRKDRLAERREPATARFRGQLGRRRWIYIEVVPIFLAGRDAVRANCGSEGKGLSSRPRDTFIKHGSRTFRSAGYASAKPGVLCSVGISTPRVVQNYHANHRFGTGNLGLLSGLRFSLFATVSHFGSSGRL